MHFSTFLPVFTLASVAVAKEFGNDCQRDNLPGIYLPRTECPAAPASEVSDDVDVVCCTQFCVSGTSATGSSDGQVPSAPSFNCQGRNIPQVLQARQVPHVLQARQVLSVPPVLSVPQFSVPSLTGGPRRKCRAKPPQAGSPKTPVQTAPPTSPPTTSNAPATPPTPAGPGGSSQCLKINAATLAEIKDSEAMIPNVYNDPIGLPTVGYGHLCLKPNCAEVQELGISIPLSQEGADKLLLADIDRVAVSCLKDNLGETKLTDNEFGALASLIFNIGCGAFQESTILRRLNAGDPASQVIPEHFPDWNKAGGGVLLGLQLRREREVKLALTPSKTIAFPCS